MNRSLLTIGMVYVLDTIKHIVHTNLNKHRLNLEKNHMLINLIPTVCIYHLSSCKTDVFLPCTWTIVIKDEAKQILNDDFLYATYKGLYIYLSQVVIAIFMMCSNSCFMYEGFCCFNLVENKSE